MTAEQNLYALWLEKTAGDPKAQEELKSIAGNDEEITDRFYRELSFGTAGLRGILGMGINRMNVYTVGRATHGLAKYLLSGGVKNPSAAIAYDSRNGSELFARHTACVFAANGIKTHLFRELMPTPALSYAVRELHCDTGVVVTASHNPAVYNGYKAYGSDGCQIGPAQAEAVQEYIRATDIFHGVAAADFDKALEEGMISYIPDSFVQQYLDRVFQEAPEPEVCAKAGLKLVYTPLNGAGNRCVRGIFERLGLKDVTVVPEQEHPDGNFPTCPYPNPENHATLKLGLALCEKTGADLFVATDPDCDRVAVAARHNGEYRILSGNELGILLLDYICETRTKLGKMPENPVAVKSLVSSRMTDKVAKSYGVEIKNVLTGFKYVGEAIAGLESQGQGERFIFAFEESCGYLSGGFVRDKDAVNASMLAVEMASARKLEGRTLIDALEGLYGKFGVWRSEVDSFTYEGAQGMQAMAGIMSRLRENPPASLAGDTVLRVLDYQNGEEITRDGRQKAELPCANMLELHIQGGSTVIIRPSGTEPKIKIYCDITGPSHEDVDKTVRRYRDGCKELL